MKKLVLLFVLCSLVAVTQAELFTNGDFEAGPWSGGGSGSGAGFGWQTMPPVFQADGQGSDGGNWMQLDTSGINPAASWGWGWSGIWHADIAMTSGTALTLSGQAKNADVTRGNTLRAFIAYTDAGGLRLDYNGDGISESLGNLSTTPNIAKQQKNADRYMPTWLTGASWAAFSDTFVVPALDAPVANMSVTLSVETLPGDVVGVDELSLVPEPATMALVGLGGLLIRRRKK